MGEELGGTGVDGPASTNFFAPGQPGALMQNPQHSQAFGLLGPNSSGSPVDPPGSDGGRYYTIQRVNGNGGNGKDSTAGPHKHTLQESDRVKKNSISRYFLKVEKVKKKTQVGRMVLVLVLIWMFFCFLFFSPSEFVSGVFYTEQVMHAVAHHRHSLAYQCQLSS